MPSSPLRSLVVVNAEEVVGLEDFIGEVVGESNGDVSGPSSSVASEIALFDGTGGKTLKRATGTGIIKATAGVYSANATITQAESHGTPDTDSGPTSLHHTIGSGANQASAGNHSHSAPASASDTVQGIVELATTAETTTGTDATRAVTPDGLHDMTSISGAAWILDEDAMGSNSDTKLPTQQSVKAYVDAAVAAAVQAALFTTAGDIVVRNATVPQRLGVGSLGQSLVADTSLAHKLKWGTPATAFDQLHPGLVSGRWYGAPELFTGIASGTYASAAVVANTIYYLPFYIPNDVTLDRIAVNLTTAVAGSTIELGLYKNNNGVPGDRVFTAGTVATSGATGAREITINQPIEGGKWYWVAFVDTHTPGLRYWSANAGPSFVGQATNIAETLGNVIYTEAGSSLPASAGTLTAAASGMFLVRVRVA